MKKASLIVTTGMILILSLSLNSCKKDKTTTASCDEYVDIYADAMMAFATNPTEDNCVALATALRNYIDKCAILTPAQKQQFEEEYSELNCHE